MQLRTPHQFHVARVTLSTGKDFKSDASALWAFVYHEKCCGQCCYSVGDCCLDERYFDGTGIETLVRSVKLYRRSSYFKRCGGVYFWQASGVLILYVELPYG